MNAIKHGLSTHGALLSGETPEMYEVNLAHWLATLRPATPGEAKLAARIADVDFRQERLARLEEKLVAAAVETRLISSEAHKRLLAAKEAIEGVQGLSGLAHDVHLAVDADQVRKLRPATDKVLDMIDGLELATTPAVTLRRAVDGLFDDDVVEVTAGAFAKVASKCREVEQAISDRVPELERAVETERERLAEIAMLGEDENTRLLHRHRVRLARELELHTRALRGIRELAVHPDEGDSGSSVFLVELRLVGRSPLR